MAYLGLQIQTWFFYLLTVESVESVEFVAPSAESVASLEPVMLLEPVVSLGFATVSLTPWIGF